MNLEFSIKSICTITGADFIEDKHVDKNFPIHNIVIDSRSPSISKNTLFVALEGKKFQGKNYISDFVDKGGCFVLTDSISEQNGIHQFIIENPLNALQEIAKHHRDKFKIPVIGITGSNGKTIVKEWLYHLLKDNFSVVRSPKSYNSQIGVALSLLEIEEENDIAIIEAAISRPGEMKRLEEIIHPTIGIFTGIGDAHEINFESQESKEVEKKLLFKSVEKVFVSEENNLIQDIPFNDIASQKNATLVSKVARFFGLEDEYITKCLSELPVVSMRLEQVEGKNNNIIINDTYNSDLISLDIAIKHVNSISSDRKRVVFLTALAGTTKKKANDKLKELLSKPNVDRVIFIGEKAYLDSRINAEYYSDLNQLLINPPLIEDAVILIKGAREVGLEKIVQIYAIKKHITQLNVNLTALRNNLEYFQSKLDPKTMTLAMVKAQSYGTGLKEVAGFLKNQKVDYFGVAYADEGVVLREMGIKQPILVMNPEENAFDDIISYNLEPSLYSSELLNSFIHHLILSQETKFPVHIKLDTGMNRLGFTESQVANLINTLKTQTEVLVKSVFSHLSVADDENENEFTYGQIRNFEMMSGRIKDKLGYPFIRHLANSAGTLNYTRAHFDMVRLGIGLFGLLDARNSEIENVLTLNSRISQIKWIEEGESVGYGRSFIAPAKTKVGIIPVGYADGLRRGLSQGNWSVYINGQMAPIIGNICMDMCIVDLTKVDCKSGDLAEIFGNNNSIFEMAQAIRTIPYEIISGVSSRVHRVYLED